MKQNNTYQKTRTQLARWQAFLNERILHEGDDLTHSIQFYFPNDDHLLLELKAFSKRVSYKIEPLVMFNNLDNNLPQLKDGIKLVMENVLHLSRLFNAFSVLAMARRAYQIAYYYA